MSTTARQIKIHLSLVRPNAFGGTTYTTLCNRSRLTSDGMNLTTDPTAVTCLFCLQRMRIRKAA